MYIVIHRVNILRFNSLLILSVFFFLHSVEFEYSLRDILSEGPASQAEHLLANPTHVSVVESLVTEACKALNIIRFYTFVKGEVRCWNVRYGKTLSEVAGLLHVDTHRNFIRADVVAYDDFVKFNGDMIVLALEFKIRNPGKKYVVNDGDFIEFHASSDSSVR